MNDNVKGYLSSLDITPFIKIKDYEIAQGILDIVKPTGLKATGETLYEIIAFELFPRHEKQTSEWGTHFGSKMSFREENSNKVIEYPSIQQITLGALQYWEKRAREAKHPILVERYADLAFDLAVHVGKKPDHTLAQLTIDNILIICELDLVEDTYLKQKLHRALTLALLINDTLRLKSIAKSVINIEKKIAEDSKAGLWGFSFEWLVNENGDNVSLSENEIQGLLNDLENRLNRLLKVEDPDPWGVECAINILVPYYLRVGDEKKVLELLLSLEDAFRRNKRSSSDGLLKVNYLEKLDALYRQYGKLDGMRSHIDRIAKELPKASRASLSSMQSFSSQIKITQEEIDTFITAIFGNKNNPYLLPDVASRLIGNFLIKKEGIKNQLDKHSKEFVFQFIVQQRRLSEDGHTEAIIPPLHEDYEAHLFNQAFQNLQFVSIFLAKAMSHFKDRYKPEEVYEYLANSPLFVEEEKEYLIKGLQDYWANNFLSTSQNFIPYIESAFRRLVARGGGITLRPKSEKEYGGYEYRGLGTLLEEEVINKIFGFDICFYFKLVLTHTLGWNLRNNLAHGINLNSFFRQDVSDRLFHILLLLGQVRIGKPSTDKKTQQ